MIKIVGNEIHGILNMPPSMNGLFAGKARRYKSEDYQGFCNYVFAEFVNCKDKPVITGDNWLEIEYTFYFSLYTLKGEKRIKDTGNFEKALTDCLVKEIKGFEDHKIYNIILKKRDSKQNTVNFKIREVC